MASMESTTYQRRDEPPRKSDDRPLKILVVACAGVVTAGWAFLLLFYGYNQCGGIAGEEVSINAKGVKLFIKAIVPHTAPCCPLQSGGTCAMSFMFLILITLIVCPCTMAGGFADWSWRSYPDEATDALRSKSILLLFAAAALSLLFVGIIITVQSSGGANKTSGISWYIAAGLTIGQWACLVFAGSRGAAGFMGQYDSTSEDEGAGKAGGMKGGKGGKMPPGKMPYGKPGGPGFPQGGFPQGPQGFPQGMGPPMGGKGGFPGGKPPIQGSFQQQDPAASSAAPHNQLQQVQQQQFQG